jgi:O-acetylserine/cysteine efflux transporter
VPRRHVAAAVVVACAWGVNFVVIDVGLATIPPLLFVAVRFALIAVPAVFLVPRPDVGWRAVVGVGLFLCVGQFGLLFVAMDNGMPAGLASLVLQLQAVFTILFASAFLAERPRPNQILGVLVAVGGMGLIGAGREAAVPFGAVVLCVLAAASWGAGNTLTRRVRTQRPFSLLVWSSLVAPGPLLVLSAIVDGTGAWRASLDRVGVDALLAVAYVVVVATFFGFGVWTWLLSRHPASHVAPFTLLVPVVGIATAWLARGERANVAELAGASIVLVGLALATGLAGSAARAVRLADRRLVRST